LESFDGLCNNLQSVDVKYLEFEDFLGIHNMVMQCMLKSNFEIACVVYKWLGLFLLMVIVKVYEVIFWMSEKDQCNQHIDVIWFNVDNSCSWRNFDEDDSFDVHYEFCNEGGVYSLMAPLFVKFYL